jgi:superfamily I DNA and RNA helicase
VAGSGKTVLLIARAKLLAEDPEKRILILCYNRLLAQHLAVALTGHRRVTVTTFHRWAVRCGVDFSEGEEDGAFGERLLARLRGDAGLRGRYDAVLIDEAQDWPCSWFQCARLALKARAGKHRAARDMRMEVAKPLSATPSPSGELAGARSTAALSAAH